MTYEVKKRNNRIRVGHLYDMSIEYIETFFREGMRPKKKDPRYFWIPSQLKDSYGNMFIHIPYIPGVTLNVAPSNPLPPPPIIYNKYYLSSEAITYPGSALVVDEIKSGSRVIYYRTWFNGEERILTENQLLYAQEIK